MGIFVWISFVVLSFAPATGFSATVYMGRGETYTNLEAAVNGMNASDTLIIRDGIYSGSTNVLDHLHMPKSGSPGSPTIIKAENDGGAVFPNSFIVMENSATVSHVDFIGLKAESSTTISSGTSYFRFMRCAFTNSHTAQSDESIFSIAGTYHLVEDSYAWGEGRYGMYVSSVGGQYIVFRRCVVRLDKVNAYSPFAPFQSYSSPDVVFQNCLVLDGAEKFWLNYEERAGCFYSRTAGPVTVDGSICLNYPSYFAGGSTRNSLTVNNSIAWDVGSGAYIDPANTSFKWTIDNVTIGVADGFDDPITSSTTIAGFGVLSKNTVVNGYVTNSILYDIDDTASTKNTAALDGENIISNYNVLFGNVDDYQSVSAGVKDFCADNANAVDPLAGSLEYLPRIERGSSLSGVGSGGDSIGATILCKIGLDGSFYGSADWNTTRSCPLAGTGGATNGNLWPWSNEDRIKTDMALYSYTGVDRGGSSGQTLSGARGFAATGKQLNGTDDITLTSYIWEYLGNPIPPNIYGTAAISTIFPLLLQ